MAPKPSCLCGACPKCRDREKQRARYRADPERHRETSRRSKQRNIERVREYDRERGYREHDQQKIKARRIVATELRAGRLKRGPCEVAGCAERAEAHHDDYSRPLDVRWRCARHHGQLHHRIGDPS